MGIIVKLVFIILHEFIPLHHVILLKACYLLSTALVFPEEEGMMQQSSVSISLSFENQGINPVGG